MAELATIARPYAEALFNASQADLAASALWLEELATIAVNPELTLLASNPKVTSDQVFGVIKGVARATWSSQTENFLRAIIENGRLSALPEVLNQFRAHMNSQSGSSDAIVYSPFDMDSKALGNAGEALQKRFGRKLNLSVRLDPALIGGVRVVVGDEVLDTSVKARLEQMKVALTA